MLSVVHFLQISDSGLSYSAIERERKEFRMNCAKKIKNDFVPPKHSVIHFDGKLLSDLSGDFGDRLAVHVSGNTEQCKSGFILSAELIKDGTGESQSLEVLRILNEWKLSANLMGMVFDTCSANTGWVSGAATKIEQGLSRPLLWFFYQRPHLLNYKS